jgi:hypothetical protein
VDEDVTQAPAENVEAVEDNSLDTSPVDEQETSQEVETEETQVSEEPTESERKPTRAERRIRELSEQVRQYRDQPNQYDLGYEQPPYPAVNPGEELTPEQYQQHVVQAANSIAQLQTQQQIQQLEAKMNLDRDIEVAEAKYPELHPETGNQRLIEKIEKRYQREAFRNNQLDPSVRLSDIVAEEVEFARAYAESASAQTKTAVAQLKDETAVRPGASNSVEKSAKDMSIEEMEAKFGIVRN